MSIFSEICDFFKKKAKKNKVDGEEKKSDMRLRAALQRRRNEMMAFILVVQLRHIRCTSTRIHLRNSTDKTFNDNYY